MATTYEKIASVSVTAATAANMEFTNIPAAYTDLILKVSARSNRAGANLDEVYIRFNGNTGNFSNRYLQSSGSASPTSGSGSYPLWIGYCPAATATASTFSSNQVYVPNYTAATNKPIGTDAVQEDNSTTAYATLHAGLWNVTDAITSVLVYPYFASFVQYSTATLYGISKS